MPCAQAAVERINSACKRVENARVAMLDTTSRQFVRAMFNSESIRQLVVRGHLAARENPVGSRNFSLGRGWLPADVWAVNALANLTQADDEVLEGDSGTEIAMALTVRLRQIEDEPLPVQQPLSERLKEARKRAAEAAKAAAGGGGAGPGRGSDEDDMGEEEDVEEDE